jgi:proline iminopeptidase
MLGKRKVEFSMRLGFFPEIQPLRTGRLKVSDIHEIYWEECGHPQGKPAVVLHGGPGGGISPFLKRLHDPERYRIVVFDQRGCGQSTPYVALQENTTKHLVEDIEKLRSHLGIERWQVVGGSWGSTLALAYAQAHPERVTQLIVRGIFLGTAEEIGWFYQGGASWLFPEAWENYVAPIPENERHDLVAAHHRRLTGTDRAAQLASARAWSQWEAATISLLPDAARIDRFGEERFATAFASIECHYFINRCFLGDRQLLSHAGKIKDIPGVIVQGRYDVVTPARSAYALSKAWPKARFEIVSDSGHTATEPGIADALIRATNNFVG